MPVSPVCGYNGRLAWAISLAWAGLWAAFIGFQYWRSYDHSKHVEGTAELRVYIRVNGEIPTSNIIVSEENSTDYYYDVLVYIDCVAVALEAEPEPTFKWFLGGEEIKAARFEGGDGAFRGGVYIRSTMSRREENVRESGKRDFVGIYRYFPDPEDDNTDIECVVQHPAFSQFALLEGRNKVKKKLLFVVAGDEQSEECQWGSWSDWHSCSRTCGPGSMTRTREVIQNGTLCSAEDAVDTKPCYNEACCTTNSGKECRFPFKYDGATYYECIEDCEENDGKGWCATEVDNNTTAMEWERCKHYCDLSEKRPNLPSSLSAWPNHTLPDGLSSALCDFPFKHPHTRKDNNDIRGCLADRDGKNWCRKRGTDNSNEWRQCNKKCQISIADESFTSELCLTKGDTPKACQFPYMLKGSERTKCVYQNRRFECPTRLDKAREPLPGSWRECKDNCADICLAKSIHFNGTLPCLFPFKYEGQDYNGCVPPRWVDRLYSGAKPWCPPLTRESEYYNLTLRAECDSNCYKASEGFWSRWWLWIVTMSLIISTHVCFIILDGAQISKAYRDAEENRKNASGTQPDETEMNDLLGGAAWPDDGEIMNNRIMHLKHSRKESGKKRSQDIYDKAKEDNDSDDAKADKYLFEYLGSGAASEYIFGHVDRGLGSWWEKLSKKRFSFLYILDEVRRFSLLAWFNEMLFNTSKYMIDIVKDIRFILLILIPLLPESIHLVIISVGTLFVSEGAKTIQLYRMPGKLTWKKKMRVVFSTILPVYLHHEEFMANLQLKKFAAMKKREPAEEKEFIKVREKLQVVLLDRAQIRSTENVLEHFPQIIIAISVLTLEGAVKQLELTEGNKLYLYFSLTWSLCSIVLGQINLISARKNGQLGIKSKIFLAFYLIVAIVPRMYAFTALLNGREAYLAFSVLALVFLLHTGLSYVIQEKIFLQDHNKFMQALWSFLTPPLFFDWDTLYRQQVEKGRKMSIQECWNRSYFVILGHNILTLIGNIALGHRIIKPLTSHFSFLKFSGSPGIDAIIKLAIMVLSQIALFALSFIYFKQCHPWARILKVEDKNCKSGQSLDQIGSAKETFKDSQLEHPHGVLVSEHADP